MNRPQGQEREVSMVNLTMMYSEERGTWNVFDGAEWILEGTYEQCEKCIDNAWECAAEEYEMYNKTPEYPEDWEWI